MTQAHLTMGSEGPPVNRVNNGETSDQRWLLRFYVGTGGARPRNLLPPRKGTCSRRPASFFDLIDPSPAKA